jgi:hypothetical protein
MGKKFNINSSNLSAGLGLNISSNQNIVLQAILMVLLILAICK